MRRSLDLALIGNGAIGLLVDPHGLLAEHVDPRSGELWGNFVPTYSMVGLITSAIRLSLPWDAAV